MVVIMSEFIHNEDTRKIFQEFESGSGHVFIQARAGTGKTTSLIEMLNHFYDNVDLYPEYLQNALVCFVAFSNEIKKDIDKRVPQGERIYYEKNVHNAIVQIVRNSYLDRNSEADYEMAADLVQGYITRSRGRKGELLTLLEETLKSLKSKNVEDADIWSQLVMEDLSDIHVKTFHGLGYGILRGVYDKAGTNLRLDNDKYHNLVKDFIKGKVSSEGYLDVMNALKVLSTHSRLSLYDPNDKKLMRELAWHFDIDIDRKRPDLMLSVLRWLPEIMEKGEEQARNEGIIDYTDMIYLPIKWEYKAPTPYKLMFIDEAQDLSKVTRNLIVNQALDPNGRAFFIGDSAQCVIDGTVIGDRKAEDIQEGELIPSGFGYGKIGKAKIDKVYRRQVIDHPVVTIKTKTGKVLTTTPNHTHFAGYASKKTFSPNPIFFSINMCSGDLDDGTVLHGCEIRTVSTDCLKILKDIDPDLDLRENKRGKDWLLQFSSTELSEIYTLLEKIRERVGVNLVEKAYLGRNSELSFISAEKILPGMKIFIDKSNQIILDEVVDVSTSLYTGGLHDFDVDKYHNYIANGIATHNSIMAFAGADKDSVRDTITLTKATELPLDICYRCPTSHIELAQKLVPSIKAHSNAKTGTLVCAPDDILVQIVKPGDMVLCRNTAPLFQKAIECLRARIPARIRGRDLCENLVTVLRKIEKAADVKHQFDYERLDVLIDDWAVDEIRYLIKREASEASIQMISDKRETLHICYKDIDAKNLNDLIDGIRSLIPSNKGEGRNVSAVEFSTVHRAKGLEAERIFILEPGKLPAIWDKQQSWQFEQEKNLLYVAITRSKEYLCILGNEQVWRSYVGVIKPTHVYKFQANKWQLKLDTKDVKDTLNEFMVGEQRSSEAATEKIKTKPHQDLLF